MDNELYNLLMECRLECLSHNDITTLLNQIIEFNIPLNIINNLNEYTLTRQEYFYSHYNRIIQMNNRSPLGVNLAIPYIRNMERKMRNIIDITSLNIYRLQNN